MACGMWRTGRGKEVCILDEAALAVALPNVVAMNLSFSSVLRTFI